MMMLHAARGGRRCLFGGLSGGSSDDFQVLAIEFDIASFFAAPLNPLEHHD
jgi:hypothetical protein